MRSGKVRTLTKCYLVTGFCFVFYFLTMVSGARGSDLVYTPTNPSFGGAYLNGSFLLESANVQNRFKEKKNPVEDFEAQLTRRVLGNLARRLTKSTFGDEGLSSGEYTIGDITIEIGDNPDGVDVTILDDSTGGTTNISIPNY